MGPTRARAMYPQDKMVERAHVCECHASLRVYTCVCEYACV